MPPLIARRNYDRLSVDNLMWPAVTKGLLIDLEPGEVIRWSGTADVAELRWTGPQDRKWELVWRLTEPADCKITDRRVAYCGSDLRQGTGRLAAVADGLTGPSVGPAPSVLAGHVRFQWPAAVALLPNRADGKPRWRIRFDCQDGDTVVWLVLTLTEDTSGPIAETIATDVVSDIARYRLAARAGSLGADRIRQLTGQRDNPTSADTGSTRRWSLEGGMRIGMPADVDGQRDARYGEALTAMRTYLSRGTERYLEKALRLGQILLEDSPPGSRDETFYINFYAGALWSRYERYGDLGDLTSVIDVLGKVAGRAHQEPPERLAGYFHNLGMGVSF